MISSCYPRSTARESDDGDQLQGRPFPTGHHAHGGAVVRGLSLELPACGRTHGGARRPGRPCDHPALGGEIQSLIGGSVSSSEAVGLVAYLALADILSRPLPSRLRRLIQPVMNPLNRFLTPRLPRL